MADNNFDRYDLSGATYLDRYADNVREDLSDMIYNIAPYQTPLLTGCGRGRARNTYSEWQIDDLGSVDPNNAVIDGADAADDQSDPSDRRGNHMQISDQVLRVSGRSEAVDKAGRRSEMGYQLAKAGKRLKRDQEAILSGKQGSEAGSSIAPSKTGALLSWIVTNYQPGATGSAGGWGTTTPGVIDPPSGGTPRALTEAMVRQGMLDAFIEGGEPGTLMSSPGKKQTISEFLFTSSARVATLYKDTQGESGQATATGAIDVFVTDFGALTLVPNRFWGHNGTVPDDTYICGLQMNMLGCLYLRSYRTNRLAKMGDAENRQLLVDYGLRVNNEAAHFAIADLNNNPMTAT